VTSIPTFEDLVGCEVSGVAFVRDYVEVLFDGPILRSLSDPEVREADGVARFPGPGSRDALCRLIGRVVERVEDGAEALVLAVAGGPAVSIPKRSDTAGPEVAHFVPMRDGRLDVGAMAIWENLANYG
jgi:hypothetical protein